MEAVTATDQKKEVFLNGLNTAFSEPLSTQSPALGEAAKATLDRLPVPNSRTEAWKYTRVSRIINGNWSRGSSHVSASPYIMHGINAYFIVFVNGHLDLSQSNLPSAEGVRIEQLRSSLQTGNQLFGSLSQHDSEWFEAINMAYATDGVAIKVSKNVTLDRPIYILHLTEGQGVAAINRHTVSLDEGARVDIIAHYTGNAENTAFASVTWECSLARNSNLHIDKVQDDLGKGFQHITEWVTQGRDSHFDIRTVTLSGQWVRNNTNVRVNGENCTTNLYGAYMPMMKEHVDNHTMIDHRVPHCQSNETYKGIVNDKASGVFNGKVFVRQDAQKTNAFQQNANILMTDDASMYSKPELEIYADDVKCSHGSTTGQFDEEAVYYLRARGISELSARKLLVQAFISEIIEAIGHDPVREYCLERLEQRVGA